VTYRGEDAAEVFLKEMCDLYYAVTKYMETNQKPLLLTQEEEEHFQSTSTCWICETQVPKGPDKVRDHCHITGKYRGPAHNTCNLQLRISVKNYRLPIFFHNLKGYDSHIIMQAVASSFQNIRCIAQTTEKYLTFSLDRLSFYDSFQHLPCGLASLAKGLGSFPITSKYFEPDLIKKGVYPYEFVQTWDAFDTLSLPPKEAL